MNISENKAEVKMGWKYISYIDDGEKYIFPIEPMYEDADIAYLPSNKEEIKKVIDTIQAIKWNRKLVYKDANYEIKRVKDTVLEFENGSLESTHAGQEFLALNMFDPDFDLEPEKVHEIWCELEKRFAECVEGKVTIMANSIIEGSVFEKVTIPILMQNKEVTLFFEGK